MNEAPNKFITIGWTAGEGTTDRKIGSSTVMGIMKSALEKRLLKKQVAVHWAEGGANPDVLVRVVEINLGNRFLKFLFPLAAPTRLTVEGQVALGGGAPQPFRFSQKAVQGGVLALTNAGVNICATQIAGQIAGAVGMGIDPAAEIATRRAMAGRSLLVGAILLAAGLALGVAAFSGVFGATSSVGATYGFLGAILGIVFGLIGLIAGAAKRVQNRRLPDIPTTGPIAPR